jgi:hypothetical protein
MTTGYIWPISAWQELVSGDLVAPERRSNSFTTLNSKIFINYLFN